MIISQSSSRCLRCAYDTRCRCIGAFLDIGEGVILEGLLLLHVWIHLLLLLHVILCVVWPSIDLMSCCAILNLGQQRRILRFNDLSNFAETGVCKVLMELSELELIADHAPDTFLVCLLKLALVELYSFVLNTLLEEQIGTPVQPHRQYIFITNHRWLLRKLLLCWVFDTVIDHLDEHSRIVLEADLQLLRLLELLKFSLVNPIKYSYIQSLTYVYTGESSHDQKRSRVSHFRAAQLTLLWYCSHIWLRSWRWQFLWSQHPSRPWL